MVHTGVKLTLKPRRRGRVATAAVAHLCLVLADDLGFPEQLQGLLDLYYLAY